MFPRSLASSPSLRFVRQPQRGEHDACEANPEFLQRSAPRYGLGHVPGQLIELVVHNFPLVVLLVSPFRSRHVSRRHVNVWKFFINSGQQYPEENSESRSLASPGANQDAVSVVRVAPIVGLLALTIGNADRVSVVRQPQRGQRDASEADAESLQRPAPCEGLGHALG
jgi:hypothetical protein